MFIFNGPTFSSEEFIFINNSISPINSKDIERNLLILASGLVQKWELEAKMELLDEEVTQMKMCLVGGTKQLWYSACCLSQVLFPCPTSLICFSVWLDCSEIYCSHFRLFLNPSWTLSSRELIISQSNFWIQERCGVFYMVQRELNSTARLYHPERTLKTVNLQGQSR